MRGALCLAFVTLCTATVLATETPQSSGTVTIYSPWAGTTVYTGQSYSISWSTYSFPATSMTCTLQYQASTDISWTTISSSAYISVGSYSWYVPSYFNTGSYRIQITDNASTAYGISDYFSVSSTSATALAVGWIVFIVIAVFLCVACGVCIQYRRRQAWYAANNRYALMSGQTTTTVITIPPGQPAQSANPPMIYAPDPMQQQQQQPYGMQQQQQAYGQQQQPYGMQQQQPAYGMQQQQQPPYGYQAVQPVSVQPVYTGVAPPMYAAPVAYVPPPAFAPAPTAGQSTGLDMTPART